MGFWEDDGGVVMEIKQATMIILDRNLHEVVSFFLIISPLHQLLLFQALVFQRERNLCLNMLFVLFLPRQNKAEYTLSCLQQDHLLLNLNTQQFQYIFF